MMRDVDGLTRHYDNPLITQHLTVALQLYTANRAARPTANDPAVFHSHDPFKCLSTIPSTVAVPPPCPSVPTATAYPYHSILTNLPLQFSPSPGPLLVTACPTISPTIHTSSHRLLSHCTVNWLSLTPHFGAIPFALATYSALLPVASIVVPPDLSAATPLCKATLPDSSFVSYSLPQLLHHLRLLHTPAIFDSTPLNPTLDWLVDHYSRITGIDCSCPHTSLPDQLLWLCSVFDLIDFLSTHFQLSYFFLIVSLPADLDCGVSLADLALHRRTDSWQLQMGPTTSSALYNDAVHTCRWIYLGLRQVGLFPMPVPSFPPLRTLPSPLGDHVNPNFNHITDDCFPLPASARSPPPDFLIPSTVPHPIAVLESLPLHSTPSSFFALDPDYPASEPIFSTHPIPSPFSWLPLALRLLSVSVQTMSMLSPFPNYCHVTQHLSTFYSLERPSPFRQYPNAQQHVVFFFTPH